MLSPRAGSNNNKNNQGRGVRAVFIGVQMPWVLIQEIKGPDI